MLMDALPTTATDTDVGELAQPLSRLPRAVRGLHTNLGWSARERPEAPASKSLERPTVILSPTWPGAGRPRGLSDGDPTLL